MTFYDKLFVNRMARLTARIGKYQVKVTDPLFAKYYVDIQSVFGSANRDVPLSFPNRAAAEQYLIDRGFTLKQ